MFSVTQKFQMPQSFKPPFEPNVTETYVIEGKLKSVKDGLEQLGITLIP